MTESTAPDGPLSITRGGLLGTIAIVLVALTCVRLGIWQLHRLGQRKERNQVVALRMADLPLHVTPGTHDTANLIYRRATVEGRFDHDHALVLPGRSLRGVPGVYVLTPAVLPGGRTAVLVNRGWVPAADATTVYLDSLRTPAEARLTGLVLAFPDSHRKATLPATRDSVFRHVWFSPDAELIRAQSPYALLPFQVQALPGPGVESNRYPIRIPPPEQDNGPHLGYAIQWFSFALIFLVGWVTLMLRRGEIRRVPRADG